MTIRIDPGRLSGTIAAPPSKSLAHRWMIAAALAEGRSILYGLSPSEDLLATLDCLTALGIRSDWIGNRLIIDGGLRPLSASPLLSCRESASTLRFLMPAALLAASEVRFSGSARLFERGLSVYETLFAEKGIVLQHHGAEWTLSGTLPPGDYTLPGDQSSQYISGLLMALPCCGASRVRVLPPIESRPYIDLTLDVLRQAGITIAETSPGVFEIPEEDHYQCGERMLEGDWSNAAPLLAFNLCGGDVAVTGLSETSVQGDRRCVDYLNSIRNGCPLLDLSDNPDLAPILMAAAALCHGAVFTGIRRLANKESSRAQVMAETLAQFGIRTNLAEDRMEVFSGPLIPPQAVLNGHSDHRIVMAQTLLCSVCGGKIETAEAVSKSYPSFFDDLARLGLKIR